MLHHRLITGAVLIAGLLGLLWLDARMACVCTTDGEPLPWWTGGGEGLALAIAAAAFLAPVAGLELARMLQRSGVAAPVWLTMAAAVAGVVLVRIAAAAPNAGIAAAVVATALWAIVALALMAHGRRGSIEGVVVATSGTLLSFAYIGVMLGVWLLVRGQVDGWVLAGAVLTVKASDSGAYFTGHAIGKHKMIPWLSPGKTWEGFAGGVVAAATVGALLAWWSLSLPDARNHFSVAMGAFGGALLGVIGPFGDLAESLLKRTAQVKDSGSLLPGMGGALDVLDSVLLAGPVVYWLLQLRGSAG